MIDGTVKLMFGEPVNVTLTVATNWRYAIAVGLAAAGARSAAAARSVASATSPPKGEVPIVSVTVATPLASGSVLVAETPPAVMVAKVAAPPVLVVTDVLAGLARFCGGAVVLPQATTIAPARTAANAVKRVRKRTIVGTSGRQQRRATPYEASPTKSYLGHGRLSSSGSPPPGVSPGWSP